MKCKYETMCGLASLNSEVSIDAGSVREKVALP